MTMDSFSFVSSMNVHFPHERICTGLRVTGQLPVKLSTGTFSQNHNALEYISMHKSNLSQEKCPMDYPLNIQLLRHRRDVNFDRVISLKVPVGDTTDGYKFTLELVMHEAD